MAKVVAPGLDIEKADWDKVKDHPVIKAMIDDETLVVDGKSRKAADRDRDENGDTPEMAVMRSQFDASYADITSRFQTSTAEVEKLTTDLATANAEISKLKQSQAPATLKAEHHGGGKFNITQGEAVLAQGLSKADADAFNAMSDAEKAAYVKESKPT
jgi:hypothetical protein